MASQPHSPGSFGEPHEPFPHPLLQHPGFSEGGREGGRGGREGGREGRREGG